MEPIYTIFGAVDQESLATVDKMAAVGVSGNRDTGMPASQLTITSVRLG